MKEEESDTVSSINEDPLKQLHSDIEIWENQSVEFMQKSTSDHELAKEIAGFATANAGRIYLGVSSNRKIVGINGVKDGAGRDKFQRRLSNISRHIVEPPIRVKVDFIESESKVVVRIDIPKGEEPVYYVDYRAYTRDLSVTRKLEPSEIRNLYREYFQATIPPATDETTNFLTDTILQLSDVQVIFSDYEDHLINPDVGQMQYDLSATGRRLLELSAKQTARIMGISEGLRELGNKLEDLGMHEFYTGRESVDEFGRKGRECTELANKFYNQVKKNMPPSVLPNYSQMVVESIESFKNEWKNATRYVKRGEPERLRESFRRFGYNFHRLGSIPDADRYEDLSVELREVGEMVRNLSSTYKYFLPVANWNPVEKTENEMKRILSKLENIENILMKKG